MAQKRMFTMKIVDSDAFLDMPLSTQCLYFHLNMRADDDGFVGNPKKIMRMIGASEDDFKILLAKKFLIIFDNNVVVIKHWWMHNTLAKDRYQETSYTDEKAQLKIKDNKAYTLGLDGKPIEKPACKQNVNKMLPECYQNDNTDKDIDKDKGLDKDKDSSSKKKNSKAALFDRVDEYTSNVELRDILKQYLKFKLSHSKNYDLTQWNIQLDMLKQYSNGNEEVAIKKVKLSFGANYQSLVFSNELNNNQQSKPTYQQSKQFKPVPPENRL